MAITQVKQAEQIRAQMLARQKRRKKHSITTTEFASMEEKVKTIRQTKRAKRASRKKYVRRTVKGIFGFHLDSTFVHDLQWFPDGRVWVTLGNKKYTWKLVPEALFNSWYKGAATCMTDDPTGARRWSIGDTPSLGAFFNHYIKNKYPWTYGWVDV